jgi:hypothetical protein
MKKNKKHDYEMIKYAIPLIIGAGYWIFFILAHLWVYDLI